MTLLLLSGGLTALPLSAQVTLYGTLSNFDVVNDTPTCTHGFEIEFHGVSSINSYYNWNRYGAPQVVPFPAGGGVYVRWMSPYDSNSGKFTTCTPPAVKPVTGLSGHQCIIGTALYASSGCEHFGISVYGNATKTIYRWLVPDAANPGKLTSGNSQVAIPAPIWSVQPPAQPAAAPVVIARVDPPIPPPPAKRYGPAQWMKTYKTENVRQVNLDELVADNPVVPEDPAEVETDWELVQTDLQKPANNEKGGGLNSGNRSVIRRFEMYKYTGAIDPITGEALCLDLTCDAPAPSELGDFIGAQNAAANLNVPPTFPVTVTVSGSGQVRDATGVIRCPGACSNSVAPGTSVTLTAKADKGVFAGWSGACAGNSLTCTVTVNSDAPVTATFKPTFKLVVKANGLGTVSSNPAGSVFVQGSTVTVTAVPAAGSTWKGWSGGGCSGLSLSCAVTVNADTTVTANFR